MARTALLLLLATFLAPALAYSTLSDASLHRIPAAGPDFDIHNAAGLLAPILIPRVPDTPGSDKVQAHFIRFFATQLPNWTVEFHNTTSTTPATGDRQVHFRNIIARRDPPGVKPGDVSRLTLAAHYDSLYRPEGFIGATDSAAPCAMLLHIARSVDAALTAKWSAAGGSDDDDNDGLEDDDDAGEDHRGVQILLLDGEEAWVQWTDTDSTYGSRALAAQWEKEEQEASAAAAASHTAKSMYKTPLEAISLFVLLDLLGAADPKVPSYFANTHWAYQHLAKLEQRMRRLGLMQSGGEFLHEAQKRASQFRPAGFISDDHVPFMRRGVDILHLIPTPFPWVWHRMEDDAEHLDDAAMQDWAKLIAAFVAEWMELDGHLAPLLETVPAEDPYEKTEL